MRRPRVGDPHGDRLGCDLAPDVPRDHVLAVWVLVASAAVVSVVTLRHDLAVVLPMLVLAPLSTSTIIPFDYNAVYNVALTRQLDVVAALALIVASGSYAVWGDRRSRRNS